jgi:hypothetical protein
MTRTTNARIAGFAFLFYIAVGITQMVLGAAISAPGTAARLALMAQHASRVQVEILLTVVTSMTALTLAVALYAITRNEDRDLATLGLCCRVGEGMLGMIAPMITLGLLWLATTTTEVGTAVRDTPAALVLAGLLRKLGGWNTITAAMLFAIGSTLFSWLLLRGRMIPRSLAWVGVAASLLLVVLLPLELAGVVSGPVTKIMWVPMAAFEIPLGLWLLIKGVAPPARTQSS